MEPYNRYNRERHQDDYYDRQSNHYKRLNEDDYHHGYRSDNERNRHHDPTYDGFDLNDSMAQHYDASTYRAENNQGGDYVYRRDRDYQDDFNQSERHPYENRNAGHYRDRFGDGDSLFNNSYAPDPYRNKNRNENYGNMAGSLSFGYDGDYNSDPHYRRRYNPMNGKIRENYGEEDSRRYPRTYGPPDNSGMNPDYDRY
jgi:hypothetical protein